MTTNDQNLGNNKEDLKQDAAVKLKSAMTAAPCDQPKPAQDTADNAATETTPGTPDDRAALITDLQKQLVAEHHKLLSTLAEMANLKKRTEREMQNSRKYAIENFAKDILETVDNLERSLAGQEQQPVELKEFFAGIELTLKSLREVLTRYEVAEINPLHQPFDHQLHTAISTQLAPTLPDGQKVATNTVLSVVQKGYRLKDRLLRPAMVIVAQ